MVATDFCVFCLAGCSRRALAARERRSGPDDRYVGWQLAFPGGAGRAVYGGGRACSGRDRSRRSGGMMLEGQGKNTYGPRRTGGGTINNAVMEGDGRLDHPAIQPTILSGPITIAQPRTGAQLALPRPRPRPKLACRSPRAESFSHRWCQGPQRVPWGLTPSHVRRPCLPCNPPQNASAHHDDVLSVQMTALHTGTCRGEAPTEKRENLCCR